MTPWQRRLRGVIGLTAVVAVVVVAFAIKRRPGPAASRAPSPIEATATSKMIKGYVKRFNRDQEEVKVEFEEAVSFSDNSTKLIKPRVTTQRSGGKTFTMSSNEAKQAVNGSDYEFLGNVHVTSSDGLAIDTERATYTEGDGVVQAPGPVHFTRGRTSGSGKGLTYNKNTELLTILEQATVRMKPGKEDTDTLDVTASSAELDRVGKTMRFANPVHIVRSRQTIDAETAVAHVTEDEERLELLELRGHAVMTGTPDPKADDTGGSLQGLRGEEIDLKYAADGRALQNAVIRYQASLQFSPPAPAAGRGAPPRREAVSAGGRAPAPSAQAKPAPRQITANAIDVTMAADGVTPTALGARENVELTVPADDMEPARTINAPIMDATGDNAHGLTRAHFTGGVQFREKSADVARTVKSEALDVKLAEGLAGIDEAVFARSVRFEDRDVVATATTARYDLTKGTVALTGNNGPPASFVPPRVDDDRITVTAVSIDLTLEGPKVVGHGSVKSELKPARNERPRAANSSPDPKVPSMLKADQPVLVSAESLDYDGDASRAVYSGGALLVQEPTRIKATSITIDDKSGDLTAAGEVHSSAMLQQPERKTGANAAASPGGSPGGSKEKRMTSVTAAKLQYEESTRRASYTGSAHLNGAEGDLTSPRIEMFFKESGDELDRVEAFESVKLVLTETSRRVTGKYLKYTAADEQYLVNGTPVTVLDQCGTETKGVTLTLFKATDKIVVDGTVLNPTTTTGRGTAGRSTTCP